MGSPSEKSTASIFVPIAGTVEDKGDIFAPLPTVAPEVNSVKELLAEHAALEIQKEDQAAESREPPPWEEKPYDDGLDEDGDFYVPKKIDKRRFLW